MRYQEPTPATSLVAMIILFGPWVLVIGCAIWVYVDAGRIGARKGLIRGLGNMGPAGWAWCTLLFWIIGFPMYLVKRDEIRRAATLQPTGVLSQRPADRGWGQPPAQSYQPFRAVPPPVTPPAGWFIDPDDPRYNRWWDGHRWTEHRTPRLP